MHIVIFYISNQSVHCIAFVIFSWIWYPNVLNCLHNSDNNTCNTNKQCVVPENIQTPTTEGIGNSRGVGGSEVQEIPEGRGVGP